MNEYGMIYKAVNIENGNVYIGQTRQSLKKRKKDHINASKSGRGYFFHRELQKYGEKKFLWSVVEDNIPIDLLNEKEIFYINQFDSYHNGYNSTEGGEQPPNFYGEDHPLSLLTNKQASMIKDMLMFTNIRKMIISKEFDVPFGVVDGICFGRSYFDPHLEYPLRANFKTDDLTEEQLLELMNMLKNELTMSMRDIAKEFDIPHQSVSCINRGIYYTAIVKKHYDVPIRKDGDFINLSNSKLTEEQVLEIIELLENTKMYQKDIASLFNISRSNVGAINRGKSWPHLYDKDYPIR